MTRTKRKKSDPFFLRQIFLFFLILTQNASGQEVADLSLNMIIGGSDASPGEFPFAVILTGTNFGSSNSNWFCGGTLLTLDAILTSASCLDEISLLDFQEYPASIFAHAGTHMLGEPSMQMGVCEEVIVHPTFEMRNGTQKWEGIDLAIVKLTRNFTDSPSLQPISKISNVTASEDIKGTVLGWGALDETNAHNFSVVLQKADTTVWNEKLCEEKFATNNLTFNKENHFCAGGSGTNIGVGDQGGPFVIRDSNSNNIDENYVFLGVALGLIETEDGQGPSIFVSLANQLDWIQEYVNLDTFIPETENQETSSETEDKTESDSTSTTFTPSSSTTTPPPPYSSSSTPPTTSETTPPPPYSSSSTPPTTSETTPPPPYSSSSTPPTTPETTTPHSSTSTEAPPPQSSTEEPTSSPTTTPSIESSTSTSTFPSSTPSSSSETPLSVNSTSPKPTPSKNNAPAFSYPTYAPSFLIHIAIVTILLS